MATIEDDYSSHAFAGKVVKETGESRELKTLVEGLRVNGHEVGAQRCDAAVAGEVEEKGVWWRGFYSRKLAKDVGSGRVLVQENASVEAVLLHLQRCGNLLGVVSAAE